jgi:hypothetical protein
MGQNDRQALFNDLELICRTVENVERFMGAGKPVIDDFNATPGISAEEQARRKAKMDALYE